MQTLSRRQSWSLSLLFALCGWQLLPRLLQTCSHSDGTRGPRLLRTEQLQPREHGQVTTQLAA